MKTISMPLDEYEKERKALQEKVNQTSYDRGALDMVNLIRERIISKRVDSYFVDNAELTKALNRLVLDLSKEQIKRSVVSG